MPQNPPRLTRRALLAGAAISATAAMADTPAVDGYDGPKPSPQQLAWQDAELSMFLHFGMNTFTNREWGEGTESTSLFNPSRLDADQWAATASEAGFRYVILTAKHHDGFCLWPTRRTQHSVAASPWCGGKGDVVAEFSAACRKHKLKMGLYLSPWDRNQRCYGDSPVYNRYFADQLTELLTRYGEVAEVWFDGACGEGPNGKRQEYDWPLFYETVYRHQPRALIAICGPDIRWVGNEDGFAHETEWSTCAPPQGARRVVNGKAWHPAECDVSIRPGWFWHQAEDARVKPISHLMDIYYRSVGHNSVLLMNVPPNTDGVIADADVGRLREFRTALDDTFVRGAVAPATVSATSAAPGHPARSAADNRAGTCWQPGDRDAAPMLTLEYATARQVNVVMLQEQIANGQRVESYRVEGRDASGSWFEVCRGTTIGHKKLDRPTRCAVTALRFVPGPSRGAPQVRSFAAFLAPEGALPHG